ncbi:AbrB/MazE/SpoVT family DNA-binding domain-containing protein [Microtetraspora malaysiensis]|uniref:AbrB/MazE/SpoVT family DNA-binding domain-containing protein n=1 Tax=Microtetraspora malaysiensis TaxID=161358 RepID=UPI003D93B90B
MEHGKQGRARRAGPARISGKNQVTLPVAVLRSLGLHAGDPVDIEEEDGRIVIRRHRSRFDDVVGTLPGFTEAVDVEAERDAWN